MKECLETYNLHQTTTKSKHQQVKDKTNDSYDFWFVGVDDVIELWPQNGVNILCGISSIGFVLKIKRIEPFKQTANFIRS